jgi:hypothetical protein
MLGLVSSPSSGGNNVYTGQLVRGVCTTRINCHVYTLLPPDDGLLASAKYVEIWSMVLYGAETWDTSGSRSETPGNF